MDKKTAKRIIERIVSDIEGRAGIGDEWGGIEYAIRKQIQNEWVKILEEETKDSP